VGTAPHPIGRVTIGLLPPPRRTGDTQQDISAIIQWLNYLYDQIEANAAVIGTIRALQAISPSKDLAGRGDVPAMIELMLMEQQNLRADLGAMQALLRDLERRI
jgi:hypothetical protein